MKPEILNMNKEYLWWQNGIIYQIYPRSFKDGNGDGIGDLPGIISKLDYLRWINVDTIWVSPIYPSPMVDFGYDVTDYTGIHPMFGTLEDFDRLVAETHARDMKIILDWVPSHTSDLHTWFLASRSSRDNPKRDWYIWADSAPDGGPPNNWLSLFGGSGWQWDERTNQYYYHSFLKEQPDLNWRNPEVRRAMYDTLRFWLDRGVDGFRVDVMAYMIKDDLLRDDPVNPDYAPDMDPYDMLIHEHTMDQPEVHEVVREIRSVLDEYDVRMIVGEIYLPNERLVRYYGEDSDGCHLPFNFQLINMPWDPQVIRQAVEDYEATLPDGAWPNWVLGNHDRHRIASRLGLAQARVAQMMLLTLRGTPTCYYGDEIGMVDVEIPPDRVQDPWGKQVPGFGFGRDPERTPMQWDTTPHSGFSSVEPWLPVAANYKQVNVEVEREDPTSMLSLYRALTTLRHDSPALAVGSYTGVPSGHTDVFAYTREHEGEQMLVALNFGQSVASLNLPEIGAQCEIVLSTQMDHTGPQHLSNPFARSGQALRLRPNEGVIARLV